MKIFLPGLKRCENETTHSRKRSSTEILEMSPKRLCDERKGAKRSQDPSEIASPKRVCSQNIEKAAYYDNCIKTYTFNNVIIDNLFLNVFFESILDSMVTKILKFMKKFGTMKINVSLSLLLTRTDEEKRTYYNNVELYSDTFEIFKSQIYTLGDILDTMFTQLVSQLEEYQERDSGWALARIFSLDLNILKYDPLNGGSFINLPLGILRKNACVNIKNNDNFCFKWSVVSYFYRVENPNDVRNYSLVNINEDKIDLSNFTNYNIVLNFENLCFPLSIYQIEYFEKINPLISINVFTIDAKGKNIVGPLYRTKKLKPNHINLLYLTSNNNSHFVLVKNLASLITKQLNSHQHRTFICNFCLSYFSKEHDFQIHQRDNCIQTVTKLPPENKNIVKYKSYEKEVEVPFVTYADFECMLPPFQTCQNNPSNSSSTTVNSHVPVAYKYRIKCSFDSSKDIVREYVQHNSESCVDHFVKNLIKDVTDLYTQYIFNRKPIIITPLQEQEFQAATLCHICGRVLGADRVRDHDHFTGLYRGPGHKMCNIKFKIPKFFPIFFHNGSRYDTHLFFTALNKFDENPITAIPQTKELYISFTKHIRNPNVDDHLKTIQLRFLDSYRFLPSSLAELAKTLRADQFHTLSSVFPNFRDLNIYRKGVFPYEYFVSPDILDQTSLPPRRFFFSKLKNQSCSLRDYRYALKLWDKLGCTTFKDFLLAYLRTDVSLLVDVFENFRKICRSKYKLDPCHFFTAPSLSWMAMLKHTNIKIELLTDLNMYNFFKNSIRGGLCQVSLRHAKANNKYIKGAQLPIENPSYLVDLDMNSNYGAAMGESMPIGDFKWLDKQSVDRITKESIFEMDDDASIGYVLEVDIDYPKDFHDTHRDLPCCPRNMIPPGGKFPKLIASVYDIKNYVIHYRHLKFVLRLGLPLVKVHRVISFRQSKWLANYIEYNAIQRSLSTSESEKIFFKLMINAIYGKTLENVDKRREVKIANSWQSRLKHKGARALVASPYFHSISVFDNQTSAVQMKKSMVTYDKPIYLGFVILEEAKRKMYDFHYNYMLKKFKTINLAYTDTDSFIYQIFTEDFYSDIRPDLGQYFDTSNYAIDNDFKFLRLNKKKLGFFKDENAGEIMLEFIGLKAKLYSFTVQNSGTIHKRAKGISASSIKDMTLREFKNCIYDSREYYVNNFQFRSKLHHIYTINLNKLALSSKDDKRHILSNNVSTLPLGHKDIS